MKHNLCNLDQKWHIGYAKMQENDNRRDKRRCLFYERLNNYCKYKVSNCCGSSHCLYYKEEGDYLNSEDKIVLRMIDKTIYQENKIVNKNINIVGIRNTIVATDTLAKHKKTVEITYENIKKSKLGKKCVLNPLNQKNKNDKQQYYINNSNKNLKSNNCNIVSRKSDCIYYNKNICQITENECNYNSHCLFFKFKK